MQYLAIQMGIQGEYAIQPSLQLVFATDCRNPLQSQLAYTVYDMYVSELTSYATGRCPGRSNAAVTSDVMPFAVSDVIVAIVVH